MIDAAHDLPVARQAEVLDLSRSSVYYRPRPVSPEDLALMRRIDELHLERPFAGSRMLRDFLEHEGVAVGRRHVATLMKRMGIEAIYRRRNSSKPAPGHKIYPYLLRGVKVERPNRVWATDITYIPMARGFVYLVAVVDWFTRRVLSHRVSITMDTTFCVEALVLLSHDFRRIRAALRFAILLIRRNGEWWRRWSVRRNRVRRVLLVMLMPWRRFWAARTGLDRLRTIAPAY